MARWQKRLSESVWHMSQCVRCRSQSVCEGQVPSYGQYETMIPTCTGTFIKLSYFISNRQLRLLQGAINVRFHNNTSTETEDASTD